MNEDRKDTQITVNLSNTINPYEDKTLAEMQPDTPILNEREPFNAGTKHGDIIVGHQRNRTLADYPRRARPWVRIYAIMTLVVFAVGILLDLVHW